MNRFIIGRIYTLKWHRKAPAFPKVLSHMTHRTAPTRISMASCWTVSSAARSGLPPSRGSPLSRDDSIRRFSGRKKLKYMKYTEDFIHIVKVTKKWLCINAVLKIWQPQKIKNHTEIKLKTQVFKNRNVKSYIESPMETLTHKTALFFRKCTGVILRYWRLKSTA